MDDEVKDEIEALRSIYCDDIRVEYLGGDESQPTGAVLAIDLYPATGDVKEEQLIKLRLEIDVTSGYPSEKPRVRLKNPRGLSDESVADIRALCEERISSQLGEPVLYDLIHLVTEALTNKNVPSGFCCICLEGFDSSSGDSPAATPVVKTNCFHHLHDPCLKRYIAASAARIQEEEEEWAKLNPYDHRLRKKNELCCPVCREVLPDACQRLAKEDLAAVAASALSAAAEDEGAAPYVPDPDKVAFWKEMRKVYERQAARGGIINPTADESRRLVVISGCTRDVEVQRRVDNVDPKNLAAAPPPEPRPRGNPRRKFSKKP